jgi:uncharacterized protein
MEPNIMPQPKSNNGTDIIVAPPVFNFTSRLCYNSAMIVDFHTHVFSPALIKRRAELSRQEPFFGALYANPKSRLSTAPELIDDMEKNQVDIAVLQNIIWRSPELCKESNDYIIESITRYPGRLIGFAMVNLNDPAAAIPEIERCARLGIRGIGEVRLTRENLIDRPALAASIAKIIENNLILLTHSSEPVGHLYPGKGDSTPGVLYDLITRFPDLKLVCAHWGGGLPYYALMPEVKTALQNVYFDSAASPYLYAPAVYQNTVDLVGADKVLFGSDYPLLAPSRLIREIAATDLTVEIKNKILAENALKLLGLKHGTNR